MKQLELLWEQGGVWGYWNDTAELFMLRFLYKQEMRNEPARMELPSD